jgi:ferredoxin-NADP reductase
VLTLTLASARRVHGCAAGRGVTVRYRGAGDSSDSSGTMFRRAAPGWPGAVGRIALTAVQALLRALGGGVDSFVCGSDGFVEVASDLLMQAGQPGRAIRTERFGPSGD